MKKHTHSFRFVDATSRSFDKLYFIFFCTECLLFAKKSPWDAQELYPPKSLPQRVDDLEGELSEEIRERESKEKPPLWWLPSNYEDEF